jgi:hypothetical protein
MENDLQVKYDSICYVTMLNVKTKTDGAKRIVFRNFKCDNKEHQFVLAVTNACRGILDDREIAIDDKWIPCLLLSHKYKKSGGIKKAKKDETIFVDVPDMLEVMRGYACELCGEDFRFGDIYDAYYGGKDN